MLPLCHFFSILLLNAESNHSNKNPQKNLIFTLIFRTGEKFPPNKDVMNSLMDCLTDVHDSKLEYR